MTERRANRQSGVCVCVRGGRLLTDAALVTALGVGDLSRQGEPPEETRRTEAVSSVLKVDDATHTQSIFASTKLRMTSNDQCSPNTRTHARTAHWPAGRRSEGRTWGGSCRGSGESGTGRPGRASAAAQTGR